jgi:copper(I)-binding protein/uncharacterized protein YcnI
LALGLTMQTGSASAHIVLSQPSFEAGQNYAAFFKVESGCEGSPTTALRVQIPQSVSVLDTPPKPGWTLNAERSNGRVTAVTWRGRLDSKTADQFGIFVKLPAKPETLYFPAVQQCEKGETRWADIPAAGQASRDVAHPAPVLQLTAAATSAAPPPTQYMVGNIMIMQPWSPATPNGATTAAAYMMVMNHASTPDTLLGGTSPAGKLEVHQMTMTNGVMSMRPVAGGLTIPGGGVVTLDPQGQYHLMLTGLKTPLTEGTRVPATLNFSKTGPVQIEFTVAPIGARAPGTEHH